MNIEDVRELVYKEDLYKLFKLYYASLYMKNYPAEVADYIETSTNRYMSTEALKDIKGFDDWETLMALVPLSFHKAMMRNLKVNPIGRPMYDIRCPGFIWCPHIKIKGYDRLYVTRIKYMATPYNSDNFSVQCSDLRWMHSYHIPFEMTSGKVFTRNPYVDIRTETLIESLNSGLNLDLELM